MKQFDPPKKKKGDSDDLDEEELKDSTDLRVALDDLEADLEDDGVDEEDTNWEYNIHIKMLEDEIKKLEKAVKLVRRVLSKVY